MSGAEKGRSKQRNHYSLSFGCFGEFGQRLFADFKIFPELVLIINSHLGKYSGSWNRMVLRYQALFRAKRFSLMNCKYILLLGKLCLPVYFLTEICAWLSSNKPSPSETRALIKYFAAMSVDSKAYFNQRMVFLRSFNFGVSQFLVIKTKPKLCHPSILSLSQIE